MQENCMNPEADVAVSRDFTTALQPGIVTIFTLQMQKLRQDEVVTTSSFQTQDSGYHICSLHHSVLLLPLPNRSESKEWEKIWKRLTEEVLPTNVNDTTLGLTVPRLFTTIKNTKTGQAQWFMPLISVLREAETHEACTSFNSRIDQAEERISEVEDQLNEIKQEGKMTEKRVKRNEQSLQELWDYVKRPNLRLIGVPECDEENESKLENTLQDIIQENFPNLARQANIQVQEIQRTPQRYSSRRATPRHIIVRFTRVEMKEKM
ncbi:LINE-1 retrotransposable element ORF1 protein [Plecturocebus cupreus]